MEDLHNEEQVERLREWWKQYGKAVIAGVVMAIIAAVAVQSWRVNQREHRDAASAEYSQMLSLLDSDPKQAMGVAERLAGDYDDTVYASLAALLHARLSADPDVVADLDVADDADLSADDTVMADGG